MPGVDYEAIVYDLDGTLVQLEVDWEAAREDVAVVLGARDVEFDGSMDLWALLATAEDAGFAQAVEETLGEHEREGAWNAPALALADELPRSVPVGVCSLNCETACHLALDVNGLAGHVDVVVGRDSHDARKPDPGPLLAVLEELGVDPGDALFVGDSTTDETAAERAGVDFQWVEERLDAD